MALPRITRLLTRAIRAGAAGLLGVALAGPAMSEEGGVRMTSLGDHDPADATVATDMNPVLLVERGNMALSQLDFQQAARLYCSAARLGEPEGDYRLGRLLLQQRGVPEAQAQGRFMILRAAESGHINASEFISDHLLGLGPEPLRPACLRSVPAATAERPGSEQPDWLAELMAGGAEPITPAEVKRYVERLDQQRRQWAKLVLERAPFHGVDPHLALSLVRAESNFNPTAVSPKNAQGLMQLIPATAARFGVRDPLDPQQNVEGGLSYLRWLLRRFDNDVLKTVAAYNAGEGAVDRHQGIPPYPETQAYVERIVRFYRSVQHTPPPLPKTPKVQQVHRTHKAQPVPKARSLRAARTPPRG